MKATTKVRPEVQVSDPPRYEERVPEPPREGEDRSKWTLVGRGSGKPKAGLPLIGLEVHFDKEQSEWVRAEAKRTGLEYDAIVKRLVDEARLHSPV
jgi:hypothetical protein